MKNYLLNHKQETLEKLVKVRNDAEKKVELLKSIKRVHKKDGSDFQNLLKNFVSEKGQFRWSYGDNLYFGNYEAEIYLRTTFNLFYDKEAREKYEKEAPEKIVKTPGLVDRVFFNADELEEEIKKQIVYYEKYLNEQNENVKNFEKNFGKIEKAYGKLVDAINETGESAQYKFQDMIKSCL